MKSRNLLLLVASLSLSSLAYSQTKKATVRVSNCDAIKSELATLQEENKYLKTSLKLNEPIKEILSDNIDFNLIKVEGNSKSQTVTLTLVLKTSIANWYIMSNVNSIFDIDGNEYKLKSYMLGGDIATSSIQLNTDVPIKCSYTFGGILPSIKIIKFFKYSYSHKYGDPFSVEFRDLTIDWK